MNWNILKIYSERTSDSAVSQGAEEVSRIMRVYWGTSWEFWKRKINSNLWDWAVDGPFCHDTACGQRMRPTQKGRRVTWTCIRCGTASRIPSIEFTTLREYIIQNFEEESRTCVS